MKRIQEHLDANRDCTMISFGRRSDGVNFFCVAQCWDTSKIVRGYGPTVADALNDAFPDLPDLDDL